MNKCLAYMISTNARHTSDTDLLDKATPHYKMLSTCLKRLEYLQLYANIFRWQVNIPLLNVDSHGSDASTDTERSRNSETEEDLRNGNHAGFDRSLSRGRQLCRWLTAPNRDPRQCLYTGSLVAIQSLRSAPTRMGICRNVRQTCSNPKGSRQLDEHWSKD